MGNGERAGSSSSVSLRLFLSLSLASASAEDRSDTRSRVCLLFRGFPGTVLRNWGRSSIMSMRFNPASSARRATSLAEIYDISRSDTERNGWAKVETSAGSGGAGFRSPLSMKARKPQLAGVGSTKAIQVCLSIARWAFAGCVRACVRECVRAWSGRQALRECRLASNLSKGYKYASRGKPRRGNHIRAQIERPPRLAGQYLGMLGKLSYLWTVRRVQIVKARLFRWPPVFKTKQRTRRSSHVKYASR
jgi:hypothetical protein